MIAEAAGSSVELYGTLRSAARVLGVGSILAQGWLARHIGSRNTLALACALPPSVNKTRSW